MERDKVEELFNRLSRPTAATKEKSGSETTWTVTDEDGQIHRYVLKGVKSLENMDDDIANLIVWIWNAKDYLRKRAKEKGRDPNVVDDGINRDSHFIALSEIANGLKHGTRKKFALGEMSCVFPHRAVSTIILGEPNQVEIDVANPSLVEFRLPIINPNGQEIGDAFDYAERAMATLENIRGSLDEST